MKIIILKRKYLYPIFLILAFICPQISNAHNFDESYLSLTEQDQKVSAQIKFSISELDHVLKLDSDHDLLVSWKEISDKRTDIDNYLRQNLSFSVNQTNCSLDILNLLYFQNPGESSVVMEFELICPDLKSAISTIEVNYNLFFSVDSQHRCLFNLKTAELNQVNLFSPEHNKEVFNINKNSGAFSYFLTEGIWHIWMGYDHILFLLSLLIPAVLQRKDKVWQSNNSFKEISKRVVLIVSSFTLAHSITLALAGLKLVSLPVSFVEPTIAFSVALVALNNILCIYPERKTYLLAFAFGLVHGFGFASVLGELDLSKNSLLTSLLSFNLGVEIGQLAIVFLFLPFAYFLRNSSFYKKIVLKFGSFLIFLVAVYWFFQRIMS